MTVYVDIMRGYARTGRRGGAGRWSHLLADDPDELAEFAALLGLPPEGLQSPGTPNEHYNVVEAVRRQALAIGAVPISYPYDTGNVIATKRLQASALDAAGRGWHVFPLRPGAKIPAVKDWEHAATVDREQIRRLWTVRLQPDGSSVVEPRNVGIACRPSGLVVIDLDLAKPDQDRSRWPEQDTQITSGAEVFAALAGRAGQAVPATHTVTTASGGQHLYFVAPEGAHLRNSAGQLGPLVDVRGEGGYVVAAGSQLHPPGHEDSATVTGDQAYRTTRNIPPVVLPAWLVEATAASREREQDQAAAREVSSTRDATKALSAGYGLAAVRGEADRVRAAPVGQRNHTLNLAAYSLGQLVAAGALDPAQVVDALTDAAAAAGLDTAETMATIDSGLSAGAKRPRAMPERRRDPDKPSPAGVAPDKSDQPTRSVRLGLRPKVDHTAVATEPDEIRTGATTDRRPPDAAATDRSERRSGLDYTIDEIDAAHAGWLFAEAWDSSSTGRQPCYPSDTLRIACEWEGLPALGKSDRRSGPRPRAPFIPAPGEELVDRDVYDSWPQAHRDEWYFSRTERAEAATRTGTHLEVPDGRSPQGAVAPGAPAADAEKAAGAERPGPDPH